MGNLLNWPPGWATLLLLPALFVAFTVHELAHALVAYLLGDTSQVERKRLSFNPLRHVSWFGLVAFLLIGLGWAKPVWVDHTRFRIQNRAFGMFLVSVAGATANLLTALLVLLGMSATVAIAWVLADASPLAALQFLMASQPGPDLHGLAVALSYYMMSVNLLLALFNLLPLPPLDGFQALTSLFAMVRQALGSRKREGPSPRPAAAWPAAAGAEHSPAQIHFDIGLDYHKQGQLDEAIARYRQATAHDEGFALAYYNLGLAYWATGHLPLAASTFRVAARSGDLNLAILADQRLQELARAEQDPAMASAPLPPPLEPGAAPGVSPAGSSPLDPGVARQVTLRLSFGGAAMLSLALAAWAFVTAVTLAHLL